jgi:hypothetical protein
MKIYDTYILLLRESLVDSVFKDKTNIPYYDMLLMGRYDELPSEYSDIDAYVEHMTPQQYLSKCAEMQGTTYADQLSYIRQVTVDKLVGLMQSGVKLDMPYLNYANGNVSQEGRHRAKAAMDYGVDKIPVLIIVDIKKDGDDDNVMQYDLSTSDGQLKLLRRLSSDFEIYLFDEVLSVIQYRRLYPTPLAYINETPDIYFYGFRKTVLDNLNEIIDLVPQDYARMDHGKLSLLLAKLGVLFILDNNFYLFNNVFEYDDKTKVGILDVKNFDVDNFYNVDDDIFTMPEKFIMKYIDKIKV